MLSKKYISIFIILFFTTIINAQLLEPIRMGMEKAKEAINVGIINGINGTEIAMAAEKEKNDAEELTKLEVIKDYAEDQLDLTEKIYQHYKDVLEAVETVSSVIKTYKKVETFYENIVGIMKLYADYGVSFTFYSLYDLDKYVNPESHTAYLNAMSEIYKNTERLTRKMKMILFDGKEGIEATDYERYKVIKQLNTESRQLLYKAENLVNMMLYVIPMRSSYIKANIEIKKSFYSYETYAK